MLGMGPKSRLNYLGNNQVGMIFVPGVFLVFCIYTLFLLLIAFRHFFCYSFIDVFLLYVVIVFICLIIRMNVYFLPSRFFSLTYLDTNAEEKAQAERLFAECIPVLQERTANGTATHNEYQMYGSFM
jgi:hypothetical protein